MQHTTTARKHSRLLPYGSMPTAVITVFVLALHVNEVVDSPVNACE